MPGTILPVLFFSCGPPHFIVTVCITIAHCVACLGGAVGSITDGTRCLVMVIGESGFEARAGPIIVSGYSGVCFEIKFSGRHRGFDGVLFNL